MTTKTRKRAGKKHRHGRIFTVRLWPLDEVALESIASKRGARSRGEVVRQLLQEEGRRARRRTS